MSQPVFRHHWDINDVATALGISPAAARDFFLDGRRGGHLIEEVAARHTGGVRAPSEKAPYDVIDSAGRRWEVRALTKNGVRFTPSIQTGGGREYDETRFLAKLDGVVGYYIANLTRFPDVPFYQLSSAQIRAWHTSDKMSKGRLTYLQAKALFVD